MKLNSSSELMVSKGGNVMQAGGTLSGSSHYAKPSLLCPPSFSPSPGRSLQTSTPLCRWIKRRGTRSSLDSWRRTYVRWRAMTRSPSSQTGESQKKKSEYNPTGFNSQMMVLDKPCLQQTPLLFLRCLLIVLTGPANVMPLRATVLH